MRIKGNICMWIMMIDNITGAKSQSAKLVLAVKLEQTNGTLAFAFT